MAMLNNQMVPENNHGFLCRHFHRSNDSETEAASTSSGYKVTLYLPLDTCSWTQRLMGIPCSLCGVFFDLWWLIRRVVTIGDDDDDDDGDDDDDDDDNKSNDHDSDNVFDNVSDHDCDNVYDHDIDNDCDHDCINHEQPWSMMVNDDE